MLKLNNIFYFFLRILSVHYYTGMMNLDKTINNINLCNSCTLPDVPIARPAHVYKTDRYIYIYVQFLYVFHFFKTIFLKILVLPQ